MCKSGHTQDKISCLIESDLLVRGKITGTTAIEKLLKGDNLQRYTVGSARYSCLPSFSGNIMVDFIFRINNLCCRCCCCCFCKNIQDLRLGAYFFLALNVKRFYFRKKCFIRKELQGNLRKGISEGQKIECEVPALELTE